MSIDTSTAVDRDVKPCQQCKGEIRRPISESRAQFATRKYCSRVCMGAARRKTDAKPPKAGDLLPAAAPARVVNGVWRPSAPGWPDQPVIHRRAGAALAEVLVPVVESALAAIQAERSTLDAGSKVDGPAGGAR